MRKKILIKLIGAAICCLFSLNASLAKQLDNESGDSDERDIERISIIGSQQQLDLSSGSVSRIDEDELTKFEYDDIARILAKVPGVNIRLEDGYGLRPNIGFRGVTPERSKKINIMEDGVVIAPAPYSAPAAYYFPLVSKMVGVEVTKGPAAIKYGPNTVAGALNLLTRPIPQTTRGQLDIGFGSDGYQKAHVHYGGQLNQKTGLLVEGISLRSDGFQELKNKGDTGFKKNSLSLKGEYDLSTSNSERSQILTFKLNYADEDSNSTYSGISDNDFKRTPYLRYAAAQNDRMQWEHSSIIVGHYVEDDNFSISTTLYRHNLDRTWNKLNGFANESNDGVPKLLDIVSDPNSAQNSLYMAVLRGEVDSSANQLIELGNNNRRFFSQGIQSNGSYAFNWMQAENLLEFGVRVHQDEILRNHRIQRFLMRSGELQTNGEGSIATTTNQERTNATAAFIQNSLEFNRWIVTAGLRYEYIQGRYQNRAPNRSSDHQKKNKGIFLPKLSALYKIDDSSVVFAGIHKGFIPTSPRQSKEIDFEQSTNIEFGYRYSREVMTAEAIGFFNNYSNLIETCSSSAGCDTDIAFSAGNVDVYGLELSGKTKFTLSNGWEIPINASYTYTNSEFKQSFYSPFSLWKFVDQGNALPYLAPHRATLSLGIQTERWSVEGLFAYTSDMPETAQTRLTGSTQDSPLAGVSTDPVFVVDLSAFYNVSERFRLYSKIDNLFDDVSIVSRRAYGARANKPRQLQVGVKYTF